jgi:hypothetical protein
MGSFLILCPVAAKIAFVTAGMIAGVPNSPTPPGAAPLKITPVSTGGASLVGYGDIIPISVTGNSAFLGNG